MNADRNLCGPLPDPRLRTQKSPYPRSSASSVVKL